MSDSRLSHTALKEIRDTGAQFAIDDFGTGFSSLSYITRFPIDWIKIDRSLIGNCTTDKGNLAVLRAIIAMAHGLDIKVIAEGVETEEQFSLLRDEQCDAAQGYYLAPPVAASELPSFMLAFDQRRRNAHDLKQQHALVCADSRFAQISGD